MGRKDWGRGGESEGMDKVEKVRVRKRWERERVGEREGGKERVWREEDRKRREEIERVGKGEKGKEKDSGYLLILVTFKTYLKEECNDVGFNTLLVLICF